MIYCTCGGQKTCFKCDGKGWIDEPEAGAEDAIAFPPVLQEYSRVPEASTQKFDAGRKKSLIAQVKSDFSIPRSSSNIEGARLKARKLAKAAKKAEAIETLGELKPQTVRQENAAKPLGTKRRIARKPAICFLTDEQRAQLVEHEKKLAKLMEVLPSAGEVAAKVELRIEDEKRAIRKLHIKASRIKKKQQLVAKIPKATD